jgi:hypothetical protein
MTSLSNPVHMDGFQLGSVWGSLRARRDQLDRLAILRCRLEASRTLSWNEFFAKNGCCGYTRAELVAFEILGTDNPITRSDASSFWSQVLGEQVGLEQELPFLKGFAEGAIAQLN